MKNWLRRIRGAIGMGVTWAAAWAPVGAMVGLALSVLYGAPIGLGIRRNATVFAVLGGISGVLFSSILRLAEGRRSFDELSMTRFVAWGAICGLMLGSLAMITGLLLGLIVLPTTTVLGAASAAGTLALAKKADVASLKTMAETAQVGPGALSLGLN